VVELGLGHGCKSAGGVHSQGIAADGG
jgi:hypothetical protein